MNRGRPNNATARMEPREQAVRDLVDGKRVWSTPKERILATSVMLAAGITQVEIADRLGVDTKTVARYVAQLRLEA